MAGGSFVAGDEEKRVERLTVTSESGGEWRAGSNRVVEWWEGAAVE